MGQGSNMPKTSGSKFLHPCWVKQDFAEAMLTFLLQDLFFCARYFHCFSWNRCTVKPSRHWWSQELILEIMSCNSALVLHNRFSDSSQQQWMLSSLSSDGFAVLSAVRCMIWNLNSKHRYIKKPGSFISLCLALMTCSKSLQCKEISFWDWFSYAKSIYEVCSNRTQKTPKPQELNNIKVRWKLLNGWLIVQGPGAGAQEIQQLLSSFSGNKTRYQYSF